jgi:Flp pilus assembly protein CpaB
MRSRGLVVAIAIVLAVVAAAAVILYTNQVREDALGDEATTVVVSTVDILPGSPLDPLIASQTFETIRVPNNALVDGAVQSVEALRGQTATAPILAREQIPASRLSSGQSDISRVGVSEGHVGVAIQLEGQRAVAGAVQLGDSVSVFVTFPQNTVVLRKTLKTILQPANFQKFLEAQQGGASATQFASLPAFSLGADFTMTLVKSARVIKISNPPTDETGRQSNEDVILTLDLLPEDAESVVFAMEQASVWLGLLPPKNAEEGYPSQAFVGPSFEKLVGTAS